MGCMGAGFTVGPLARKGDRSEMRGMGNKVSSDKELIWVGRIAEGDQGVGSREEGCEWRDQIRGCGDFL